VGARLVTSLPVVMETFTSSTGTRLVMSLSAGRAALEQVAFLRLLECRLKDLKEAWGFFARPELHKLSAVDATSFVLMKRESLRRVFTFDHHFATAGFQIVG